MLKITTDKNCEYIWDIKFEFKTLCKLKAKEIAEDPVCIDAIKGLAKAEVIMENIIRTPFGVTTFEKLPNGCKTLILAYFSAKEDGYPISTISAGDNVISAMLYLSEKYNVDFNIYADRVLSSQPVLSNFELNGKMYYNKCLMDELIDEYPEYLEYDSGSDDDE